MKVRRMDLRSMWCLDLIMEHYVVAITVYKAVRFPTIERYRYR